MDKSFNRCRGVWHFDSQNPFQRGDHQVAVAQDDCGDRPDHQLFGRFDPDGGDAISLSIGWRREYPGAGSLEKTMKAIRVYQTGEPEVMRWEEVPDLQPG